MESATCGGVAQDARPCGAALNGEGRRLRIGYVSPNFCDHCQALFITPLLVNHNHEQFEIFCYSDVLVPDAATDRLRGYADHWRNIVGVCDTDAAEMIRRDGIDVLVDLTLHMARNRLLVFARKPAPVQVTWLGYPGTTGLEAIDYRLTDPHLDPPGEGDRNYSEKSWRLSDTFWCYDPLVSPPPEYQGKGNENAADARSKPNALPALENGFVTFGCLNNFCKVNDGVLELWATVLRAVAGSRLILLAPPGSARQRVLMIMHRCRVERARIRFADFQPRRRYLELYHQIDIGLDTFPYNGHTTTLDALWMGVPVVTLVGKTVVGRAGLSQLRNLGLEELAANSAGDFVRITTEWTADLSRLSDLRQNLRHRMRGSSLMDAGKFAREIERAYREMSEGYVNSKYEIRNSNQ